MRYPFRVPARQPSKRSHLVDASASARLRSDNSRRVSSSYILAGSLCARLIVGAFHVRTCLPLSGDLYCLEA